jgi:hypothetical protein
MLAMNDILAACRIFKKNRQAVYYAASFLPVLFHR